MIIRLGLVGSHSVGKTTVAEPLAAALGLPRIAEIVRTVCAERGIANVADIPDVPSYQVDFLARQIHEETYAALGFVSDRTTVDNTAYMLRYAAHLMTDTQRAAYIDRACHHAQRFYTHLVYFPVAWDGIDDDGFRGTCPHERRAIDHQVNRLIGAWTLERKVLTVTAGSVADRVAQVVEFVQGARVAA